MEKTQVRAFGIAATTLLAVRLLAVDGVWTIRLTALERCRETGRMESWPGRGCDGVYHQCADRQSACDAFRRRRDARETGR
jgi:hypothetical protein